LPQQLAIERELAVERDSPLVVGTGVQRRNRERQDHRLLAACDESRAIRHEILGVRAKPYAASNSPA
jgi:hypothetical protein